MTSSVAPRRILLYSDGNINLIDGSTIWLVSMAEVLARTGSHVTLLLKAKVVTRRMLEPLIGLDNVTIVDPFDGRGEVDRPPTPLSVNEVARLAVQLDRARPFDKVIVRGFAVSREFVRAGAFRHRLWPYVIDLPEPAAEVSPELADELAQIALTAERMLVQTEDSRSYMEFRVPASVGKCVVLNPMIPDDLSPLAGQTRPAAGRLRGVYAGKFAEGWHTLELCELPRRLAGRGIDLSLSMIGDKFMQSVRTPGWRGSMQRAVTSAHGVEWAGGLSRDDALAYARTADIGFSWRAQALDSTHEISTKVLEYCAMGVAPVLNRIAAHVDLLGEDYPLYVDASVESVEEAISAVAWDPDLLEQARKTALDAVDHFRMATAARRIQASLEATETRPGVALAQRSALLVGESLQTSAGLRCVIQAATGTFRAVEWDRTLSGQDAARTAAINEQELIVVEDAEPYLPWVTRKKADSQRLIVHIRDPAGDEKALRGARIEAVDAFVFDIESDRAAFAAAFDVPAERLHVLALPVDADYVNRPGLAGRQFRIGVLDLCPSAARPDVAVNVLRELAARDWRYSLHVRDRLPWERDELWADRVERDYYQALLTKITEVPDLQSRVAFEAPGADLPGWYRKIGWLVVPGRRGRIDHRVFEAQAAGVIVRAPADKFSRDLYGDDAVFSSPEELVDSIATVVADTEAYERASGSSRRRVAGHDLTQVRSSWESIVTSTLATEVRQPGAETEDLP